MPRKPTGNPVGRPEIAPEERVVKLILTLPPDLAKAFREKVPNGKRSAYLERLMRAGLDIPKPKEKKK